MTKSPRAPVLFHEWKGAVNACIVRRLGLHADDLPDWDYRRAYDDKKSPTETANAVIRAAKKEMGL